MKEYFFFFDDNNEFICNVTEDDMQIEILGEDAIDELIKIDGIHFNKVRASNRSIRLHSDNTSVTVSDLNEFYSNGFAEYIPSIMERVNKAIEKNQKAKHHNEQVKNMKVAGGRIAVGALIFTILGTSAGALVKHMTDNKNDNNNIGIEVDYPEMPTIPIDEYNNMIDELEESSEYQTEIQSSSTPIEETPIDTAYIRYDDLTSTDTYMGAYDGYYSIVEKYSTKWGISPNIIMAMLTQESAGKQVNLMQIQFDSWIDQVLTEYDFVNERYQSIVLTDHPERYAGQNITVITREDLQNKKTNISVACVILRYCLNEMDYNIIAAIQAYNLGCPNMRIVLAETSRNTGISIDSLLDDPTNVEFQNYTHVVKCGDPKYVSNVCRYLTDGEITIQRINEEGKVETLEIAIAQKQL